MPWKEDGSRKTIAYKKSSGFKMTGSPHKTGVIEGTPAHASALKHAGGVLGMGMGSIMDMARSGKKRRDEQRRKNQAQIAQNKEAERLANMENPSTPNRPAPAAAAPITPAAPVAPTVDPNAPMGSEGALQPDPEELGIN